MMNTADLKIEYVPIGSIKKYKRNAKLHPPEQIREICESIKLCANGRDLICGFKDPIAVWHNEIVEGHGRHLAAQELGLDTVPIIRLDDMTDEQRRAYMLIHNQTTMNSGWDEEMLSMELDGIGLDMSVFGFELPKTPDEQLADVREDDYDQEPPEEPKAKRGDIYQLGQHRLMCGDSTSSADMDALMDGDKPVLVFTDPPYGVSIGSKNAMLNEHQGKGGRVTTDIENDTATPEQLYGVLVSAFKNLREHCAENCSYYVSSPQGGELCMMMMMMMMKDAGLPVRHMLVWVKNAATFSMGRLDYDYRHEPIFYTWTQKHDFYGGYSNTVIDDTKPIDKMSKSELKDLVRAMTEKKEESVIYCDKPMACDLHPTMKPIKLVARFVVNSSKEGDIVGDIFGGSGTTILACEQLGRRCRMMELDPRYVDVIIDRWEKFTGEKAVLLNRAE